MEQKDITIATMEDLRTAIKFVNINNYGGHTGFFKALTIKCNVNVDGKAYLVNYLFKNKDMYTAFKRVLRRIEC